MRDAVNMTTGIKVLLLVLVPIGIQAGTIEVPGDFPTIQEAIDAAVDGDVVLVSPGTYVENIDFLGKAITVQSTGGAAVTTIDADGVGSVVTFASGEGPDSVIEGFAITGGLGTVSGSTLAGGGVYCQGASPTILNNTITGNGIGGYPGPTGFETVRGGGVYGNASSYPTIQGNVISNNLAVASKYFGDVQASGGGIHAAGIITGNTLLENAVAAVSSDDGSAVASGGGISGDGIIANNTICDNSVSAASFALDGFVNAGGGGLSGGDLIIGNLVTGNSVNAWAPNDGSGSGKGGGVATSAALLVNNTISGNGLDTGDLVAFGSGLVTINESIVSNCVVWANSGGSQLAGSPSVSHSNVQGGEPGLGNIDLNPQFVDPDNDDYHLQPGSPCINLGTNNPPGGLPMSDADGNPRVICGVVDMGAYEAPEPPDGCANLFLRGDADGDGVFNALADALHLLTFGFLGGPPPPCLEAADADGDATQNPLSDALHILTHGFIGGPPPPAPYPSCGGDPEPATSLGCDISTCP